MPRNLDGLKLGHGWNRGLKGYMKGHPAYNTKATFSGKKHTEESKEKMRLAKVGRRGELANNWQGGLTRGQLIRMTADFKDWRKKILERDNYTCQICLTRGGKLEVDHIKSFSGFPELRLEMSNGRTLCKQCHRKTPTFCRGKAFDAVSV